AELLGFIWMPLMLGAGERLLAKAKGKRQKASEGSDEPAEGQGRKGAGEKGGRGEEKGKNNENYKNGELIEEGIERAWRGKVWAMGLLGLSYGAFIWSHPPTAYQFSLSFGLAMMMLALVRREWLGLIWIGLGAMLGIGLAAAYIVPAALEQNL